ncbi:MAG: thioredoxin-disulfide reductase [Candidatus Omnitrophica bacterium]|nr:thioredoxin-disulfide reductase [Candidatus Omnitrophota bacterium]
MYDLIIIGAGPAGLTAALYAGRSRLNTLILEKMSVGGRIILSENIENFPGFPGGIATRELINRMEKQVTELGMKIESAEALEIDCKDKTVKTAVDSYQAKSVIIATGARPRKLNVPGEKELIGRGVSYCATCDGPLYRDKEVVVVGGGNAVAEEALYLSRFARKVSIVHRRDDLRASAILQERLRENKKIHFILSAIVIQIIGDKRVAKLKLRDLKSQAEKEIACDGIFIYIGYEPETDFLRGKVAMDGAGFIITPDDLMTSEEGIFACGDCTEYPDFITETL